LHSNIEIFTRIFQIPSTFDIQKVTVHKIELSKKKNSKYSKISPIEIRQKKKIICSYYCALQIEGG
jgi:hypothetical protein